MRKIREWIELEWWEVQLGIVSILLGIFVALVLAGVLMWYHVYLQAG